MNNKPNILFLMVDELRYPQHENEEIKEWRNKNLKAEKYMKTNGITFENHYTATTACSPSRTSLFTGQYPTLHGVSNTEGIAKSSSEQNMFWLHENTVPTMGNYFREADYNTIYKGKWHISNSDLRTPISNSNNATIPSYNRKGIPENAKFMENINKLDNFGFDGYIGPEPVTANPLKSGGSSTNEINGRDIIYTHEIIEVLDNLDKECNNDKPWLAICSLVMPHDIALYGEITKNFPIYDFSINPSVPYIPPSPTSNMDLSTNPDVQQYYKEQYQITVQPTLDTEEYRRLYYSMNLEADKNLYSVIKKLNKTRFADNTIIVLTSDHGEMLGSHGLFQKWYNAFDESIHVPLYMKLPNNLLANTKINYLTSHVDIIPTLLGLCNLNIEKLREKLKCTHTEARKLVGKDLSKCILKKHILNDPILFGTWDNVFLGSNMISGITNQPYLPIPQPTNIKTIILIINNIKYKYSEYFDDRQFWSRPFVKNTVQILNKMETDENETNQIIKTITYSEPKESQFEMYNMTIDPNERFNLANEKYSTPETREIQKKLAKILKKEVKEKFKYPRHKFYDHIKLPPIA